MRNLVNQWKSDRKAIGRQWESVGRTGNCLTIVSQSLRYSFPALLRSLDDCFPTALLLLNSTQPEVL